MANEKSTAKLIRRLVDWLLRHSTIVQALQLDLAVRIQKLEEHAIPLLEQRIEAIEKIPADGYIKRPEDEVEKIQVVRGYTPFSQRKREFEARHARPKAQEK